MNKFKNKIVFMMAFMFLLINCAYAQISVGKENYYAVYWSGKLVGYSHYFVSQKIYLGDKEFLRINSDSQLKIGMGGIESVQFVDDTFIDKKTYMPSSLNLLQETKDSKINIHALFSNSLIIQKNFFNDKSGEYMEPIKSPVILFSNNLWGAFNTLADQFEALVFMMKDARQAEFSAYDPLLKSTNKITVVNSGEEKIKVGNNEYGCVAYKILDSNKNEVYKFYMESKKMYLVKAEQANGLISMVISNEGVVGEVSKSKGVDLWDLRVAATTFVLPNASELDFLKVKISGVIFGDIIKNYKQSGFRQKYYTETKTEVKKENEFDVEQEISSIVNENEEADKPAADKKEDMAKIKEPVKLDGIIEVKTNDIVVSNAFKYPAQENFSDDIKKYLGSEFGIDVADKVIKEKSAYVALNSRDSKTAAARILTWIRDEISVGPAMPSARLTFDVKQGNSETISMLAVNMCRSIGIPTRTIGGLIYSGGNFVPHTWIECYVAPDKWVSMDPALGEVEKISAVHIALWHKGDIENPQVKILDFSPNPAPPVAYSRVELKWALGEERKYKILKGEKEIGEETVILKELAILQDKEVFSFVSVVNVTELSAKSTIKANYYLDPYGLPVYYKIEMEDLKEKLAEEYDFGKNFVTKISIYNNKKKEVSLPVSKGAYLADKRILSQACAALGQLPEVKIGKTYKISLFLPDTLKTETVDIKVDNAEYLEINGKRTLAFVGNSPRMNFWVDKDGRVLKIDFPEQEIKYELVEYKSKL